jgi:hypothetical protein
VPTGVIHVCGATFTSDQPLLPSSTHAPGLDHPLEPSYPLPCRPHLPLSSSGRCCSCPAPLGHPWPNKPVQMKHHAIAQSAHASPTALPSAVAPSALSMPCVATDWPQAVGPWTSRNGTSNRSDRRTFFRCCRCCPLNGRMRLRHVPHGLLHAARLHPLSVEPTMASLSCSSAPI